ncbi:MAG: RNA polymerase sigma-54 factor [Deltaproteobacteria bacterium GWC2_56_8]|nr:MAG: RNA polymerase sigma-54 factor [Deltaproteobacteria bacterium GWB2_55_19]OGP32026.1 MAG: RNA polymerase sigma-54 factor [Deltaproteobacteria bacterium GWC2_56_8]HAO93285.1 RNA polymerase sigma-54 factor [Deltaproteobacteria bacterium]
MGYELKQELKLTQNLVMTPQLQLAIKLLQLSRLELVDMVREEVQTNPVLEDSVEEAPETEAAPTPEAPAKPEIDWDAYLAASSESRPGIDFNQKDDEEDDFMSNVSSSGGSLSEHLVRQLNMYGLPEYDLRLGEFIIGNIEEGGYLRLVERGSLCDDEHDSATLREIAVLTGASVEESARVLGVIQQFDPTGVGARNLRECLLIQARNLPVRDTVVEDVISRHLENLGRKNYKAIARNLGVTIEEVFDAGRIINKCLNPTPGAGFGADESRSIVPDVYITKVGDDYVITLNDDGMPKLKISPYYRQLLKGNGNGAVPDQAKGYIQDKLRSAVWLIKSVHQRQRTIYRVVECIVRFQREFLDRGLKYLKPLVLKNIAEEIGVHESTVSRVTSNKYVQTPRGIFELKYFFSTGMSSSDGSDVAVEYIKEKLSNIIKSEDARNPLSDKQIVDVLSESGIVIARRTAAKYREALGFLSSSRRKAHY